MKEELPSSEKEKLRRVNEVYKKSIKPIIDSANAYGEMIAKMTPELPKIETAPDLPKSSNLLIIECLVGIRAELRDIKELLTTRLDQQ